MVTHLKRAQPGTIGPPEIKVTRRTRMCPPTLKSGECRLEQFLLGPTAECGCVELATQHLFYSS